MKPARVLPAMLPITLAPQRNVTPDTYVMHLHSSVCHHCGLISEWTALYVKTNLRARNGLGKYVTNLRPLERVEYSLPIEVIEAPPKEVAFCSNCYSTFPMASFPPPPKLEEDLHTQLENMALIKNTPTDEDTPKSVTRGATKSRPRPTLASFNIKDLI